MNSLGVPDSGVRAAPALAWNVSGTIAYMSSLFRAAKPKPGQRIKIDPHLLSLTDGSIKMDFAAKNYP